MNRIICALFLIAISSNVAFGQLSLEDLLKGKVGSVTTSDVTKDAIVKELSVIRQQYRLRQVRTEDYFGKNGKSYYGETYTLAIKIPNGTIVQNRVIEPWIGDADYKRVNKTGKYEPVRFWSYQRNLNDSLYEATELEIGSSYMTPTDTDSLIYTHKDSQADFGLAIDDKAGDKDGYMVWAYASTNIQDSAMTVSLKQTQRSIVASADSAYIQMSPSDNERVIGGLYVVPRYERGGRVQIMLVGVAARDASDKWRLVLLTKEKLKHNETSKGGKSKDTVNADDSDAEPTPIKKGKDNNRDKNKKKKR